MMQDVRWRSVLHDTRLKLPPTPRPWSKRRARILDATELQILRLWNLKRGLSRNDSSNLTRIERIRSFAWVFWSIVILGLSHKCPDQRQLPSGDEHQVLGRNHDGLLGQCFHSVGTCRDVAPARAEERGPDRSVLSGARSRQQMASFNDACFHCGELFAALGGYILRAQTDLLRSPIGRVEFHRLTSVQE